MHEERITSDSLENDQPTNRVGVSPAAAVSVGLAYVAITAATGWLARGRLGDTGVTETQAALAWLFVSLGFAAAVLAWMRNKRLQSQLATAKEKLAASQAKLDALARHDMLTGALNRRALIETLEWELLRSKRTGHPFSFAIVDLDHFRLLNEKFGSASGDLVLKAFAETSMKLLRALDRFGRIGGEEFGIVLPATWLDQGVIALGRLSKAVEGCDWEAIAPGLHITFSAGITTNAVNDSAESILTRADEALLQAKREGRNRVVQAEEALPDMPPMDLD